MLLQNTLDLSTFEIVRFRIWNQTSNPDDYGVGTKYFNTNSGHEGYNRENIYTATGWRRTAYMDDIEALTNGEGSLGTRVKALEDMLGLEDVTDVIDTWNDVKEFFANVDEGLNLMTMLDGKAEWNKNISSDSFKAIGYGTTGANGWKFNGPALSFGANSTYYAQLQINFQADNIVFRRHTTEGFTDWKQILHEGNVGDYALKVDGRNAMTDGLQLLTMGSGTVNVAVTEGLFIYRGPSSGGTDVSLPGNYINVFNVGGANAYSNLQLAWRRDYPNPALYARIGESTNYSDWKTIAFTDSDITGNAATATKLKNKVSLWGNEFDGTGNVSGNISIGGGNKLYWYNSADNYYIGSSYTLSKDAPNIDYCGFAGHRFIVKTSLNALLINSSGNVTIGSSDLASEDYKLYVDGLSGVYSLSSTTPSLGELPERGLVLFGWNNGYGMSQWIENNGNGCIQVGRFDGTATAYALRLNPLGGEVNVGGNVRIANDYGLLSATTSGSVVQMIGIGKNNALFVGTDACIVNKMPIGVYGSLINFYTGATLETRTKTMTLTSSGHVLIGGAEDDGISTLKVKGVMYASAIKTPTIYIECAEDGTYGANGGEINRFNGTIHMQYASQKDITLCYGGGNVGIGVRYPQHKLDVLGDSYFDGTVYIPTGQTLTIGSVTFRETAAGEVEVDGNLHATGTLASGGKGEVGENTTGNAMVYQYDLASGESVYTVDNVKGSTNVIVQIFEWNSNTSSWDMILTDVSVKADAITVTFGRTTTVNHMVTVC